MYIARHIAVKAPLWDKKGQVMPHNVLRLVERDSVDKQKALEAALGQIERAFGKG